MSDKKRLAEALMEKYRDYPAVRDIFKKSGEEESGGDLPPVPT